MKFGPIQTDFEVILKDLWRIMRKSCYQYLQKPTWDYKEIHIFDLQNFAPAIKKVWKMRENDWLDLNF